MNRIAAISVIAATTMLAACAAPPARNYGYSAPEPAFPDVTHSYVLHVKDGNNQPIEGAKVSFTVTKEGRTSSSTTECTSDSTATCALDVQVSQDPSYKNVFAKYSSSVTYSVTKDGYYSDSGKLTSSFGSKYSSNKDSTVKGSAILYRPVDYLSEAFLNSTADRDLREKAIKFISVIRLQSLIVDADVMRRGTGTSTFKGKKYFQMKISTTTTYNSLKLDKYAIAKRLFDDSIRKILNPLNDNISNPKTFYGYDLVIYGGTKSFADEFAASEKIEYRFLIPQDIVRRYKEKDLSGQQLLDASVILMNDERIDLKLQ